MLPAPRPLPQAESCRLPALHAGALALAALGLAWSLPAAAQDDKNAIPPTGAESGDAQTQPVPAQSSQTPPGPTQPTEAESGQRQVAFEANELQYASDNDVVTASGNVVLRSEGQSVRADSVSWVRLAFVF